MVTPIEQHLNLQAKFGVIATSQGKASLTFTAVTKPDVDIIYYVFVVGSEPVQNDIVAWSPNMTSNVFPKPWNIAHMGWSNANVYKVFDDDVLTSVSAPANQDIDRGYLRLAKYINSYGVPWTIYGVKIVCSKASNYNNLPRSMKIYGTDTTVANSVEIATLEFSSVVPSVVPSVSGTRYTYVFTFDRPAKYSSYVFSMVVPEDESVPVNINEIYFLRSKTDILAEGGTV